MISLLSTRAGIASDLEKKAKLNEEMSFTSCKSSNSRTRKLTRTGTVQISGFVSFAAIFVFSF